MKRIERKNQLFEQRERDILDASLRLFDQPDWEAVTVAQIAQEAGIGKGTIYKHFESKEAIYATIALELYGKMIARYESMDLQQPIDMLYKAFILYSFKQMTERPAYLHLHAYCKRPDFQERLPTELKQQFESFDDHCNQWFGELLTQAMARGELPERPMETLMVGMEATYDGAITMLMNNEVANRFDMDENDFIEQIADYMISGLIGLPAKEKTQ